MSHKDGDQTTRKKAWQTIVLGGGPRRATNGTASGGGGHPFSCF